VVGYRDPLLQIDDGALTIRRYYFPFGSKRVPLASIREVRRRELGTLTGGWRIWGTANPRRWWNLDPSRPRKSTVFLIDAGAAVEPAVTPDDPAAFAEALGEADVPVSVA
jgi:hypothetical protein